MSVDLLILADDVEEPELAELATQATIVQSLDDVTRYTLRFDVELVEDGLYSFLDDARLQPGALLSLIARDGVNMTCLVRGPIDRARVHIEAGGSGSWLEVMGGDRRVEMDRIHNTKVWPESDGDIATAILAHHGFEADVAATDHAHGPNSHTQNQSATDLAWVQRLARRNGYHFWLSYEVKGDPLGVSVTETAHFKPSPARPDASSKLGAALLDLLPGGGAPELQINVDRETEGLSSFDIEVDVERPTQVLGVRVAEAETEAEDGEAEPPNTPLGDLSLRDVAGEPRRSTLLTTAGDVAELKTRARAALAESEWFVRGSAQLTSYAIGGRVLQPHMVVPVVGLGARYSGDYFITTVTHTFEYDAHVMDVELVRNALGKV